MKDALAHRIFVGNPLDSSIPVPPDLLFRWSFRCDCDPDAWHDMECRMLPSYADTVLQVGDPGYFDNRKLWWEMKWVCYGRGMYEDEGHVGGEINGPTHWCEREGRVVTQDDS